MMVIDPISLTASGAIGTGGTPAFGGAIGTGGATGSGGAAGTGGRTAAASWVGTWSAAPQLTELANLPPASLSNSTLRQIVHVTLGGSQLRVRFSNEFGNGPLTIHSAHVAVCRAIPVDSSIDTATDKALAFSGNASVTIAQGAAIWSDPVALALAPLGNLSVTVAFGSTPSDVTGHPASQTTSYQQTADMETLIGFPSLPALVPAEQSSAAPHATDSNVSAADMASAQKTDHWYILSGVDVMADGKAIVVLGDSIADGLGSTTNGNDRWPDALAKRLHGSGATTRVAILNQGIGGNAITTGGLGPTALNRFSRDVLGGSGVRWVILLEGVNDIGAGVSAASLTSAFDTMIAQAHAHNLLVYGATITPFGSNPYYSSAHESVRQTLNRYIRSGKFDGTIDFDAAVRDTSNPPKLQSAYDSGDGLHLNPAGYQKMADVVDLALFTP
jgi:lysophospholipase L1-like esterase